MISNLCQWDQQAKAADVEIVYRKVYEDFVEAMDGIDNGVNNYPVDIKPKYKYA